MATRSPRPSVHAAAPAGAQALVARVGPWVWALPIAHVVEVVRPLRIEPVAGAPDGVLGVAVVRGEPTAVVDPLRADGASSAAAGRWVIVRTDGRRVALAVDEVVGVMMVDLDALPPLSPLLAPGARGRIAALGVVDGQLLAVLATSRLVTDLGALPPSGPT